MTPRRLAPVLRALYYVGPLLLWMALIFALSTDRGSAAHTRPAVQNLLLRLWPGAADYFSPALLDRIDWDLRKSAHVTEYAILGLLAFRAVAYGDRRVRARNVLLPLAIGILYAASDEIHQSFVPSRGAAAADVFYDTFGVLAALVVSLWRRCAAFQTQPNTKALP